MQQFKAVPKKWGNSIGITIPSEVIRQEHVQPQKKVTVLIIGEQQKELKRIFGTLKLKKPTQEALDETDQGYDEH